jgi:hypothetical protein
MSTARHTVQKRHVQLKDCCSAVSLHGSMHGSVTCNCRARSPCEAIRSSKRSQWPGTMSACSVYQERSARASCHHRSIIGWQHDTTCQVRGLCRWHFRLYHPRKFKGAPELSSSRIPPCEYQTAMMSKMLHSMLRR